MSYKEKNYLKIIIKGNYICGRMDHDVLVTKTLELKDYPSVTRSKIIICETGLPVSHIGIVCRTLGITVVQVEKIDEVYSPNLLISLDIRRNKIIFLNNEQANDHISTFQENEVYISPAYLSLKYQLGIINDLQHIRAIVENTSNKIEQLFLRSELVWLSIQKNPYCYLNDHGIDSTMNLIYRELKPICKMMKASKVKLHFRGLDLRSDDRLYQETVSEKEPNPALGLHGLRQLLKYQDYFSAELMAIDKLAADGYENVIYSLPFVTSKMEVEVFFTLCKAICRHYNHFGVYIETPAAAIDIKNIISTGVSNVYIGTKDLAQLTLAVDRDNKNVMHLMDLMSFPVLEEIRHVIGVCDDVKIPVYVFASLKDIPELIKKIPNVRRVSVPAAEYFQTMQSLEALMRE